MRWRIAANRPGLQRGSSMHTLLISPNRSFAGGEPNPAIGLPIGLLYVAAALEQAGHSVSVLDCVLSPNAVVHSGSRRTWVGLEQDEIRAQLLERTPDVVGIGSMFTVQWDDAARLIETVSSTLPGVPIVVGGAHAAFSARRILEEHAAVDFVMAGEGEISVPRLVRALEDRNPAECAAIPGLAWRTEEGEIRMNPSEPVMDLDVLPLPAYHLVDVERLFALQERGMYARDHHPRSAYVVTSRGCPYTCTFCSVHLSMGRRWRFHSAAYVVGHIRHLVERYGVRHIHIEDDAFTQSRSRAAEICGRLIEEAVPVTWDTPNGVRADTLTDELIAVMKRSGCVGLDVAAESGDPDVVKRIVRKQIDLRTVERAAALCRKNGVPARCFFVVGFPGETRGNIRQTLRFALHLYTRYNCVPMLNIATPLPGTHLAAMAEASHALARPITPENLLAATLPTGIGRGMIQTAEFDPAYLRRTCVRFIRSLRLLHAMRLLAHPAELLAALRRRMRGNPRTTAPREV